MSVRRVILCEDKYGGGFFKELIKRLKSVNLVATNLGVDVKKFYGPCNVKLERQLLAISLKKRCVFIIVADADRRNIKDVESRITKHVPQCLRHNTRVVILDCEIEDWICVSLDMKGNEKSAAILKHRLGYRKYRLKSYAPKLDLGKLRKCRSFQDFINSL